MAHDFLVSYHVSGLSDLFNKVQKKPDEAEILHLLLHGSLTRYLYSMCWYNDDDTTKYCQYTIGGYVSSFDLLFDSNGSRKLKEAVQSQTEFSPMVALVTEKISDGLVF